MYEIREGKDEDRDSAIRLFWKVFEPTSNLEEIRNEYWAQGWHRPEDHDWGFVARLDGKVVANVSFFSHSWNLIRGNNIKFAAVWGVATEPQHRRKGLIRKLFTEVFPKMRDEGLSLTILDPFLRSFYERFGYALAETRMKHILKPSHLRPIKGPSDVSNRELEDPEESETIYEVERSMARFGSRAFHTPRTLQRMIKSHHFHLLERNGEPVGAVKFVFKGSEDNRELIVGYSPYTSDYVFPAIVELISQYAVPVKKVSWICDTESPVRHFLAEVHDAESHSMGCMMMRVVDFEDYCQQIKIPETATESVVLRLVDDYCPWNNGVFRIEPSNGRLEVERSEGEPEIELDAHGLSGVISGHTPSTVLRAFGEITCSANTAANLEAIFPQDAYHSYQRF
ncbi:MAG: GNAT family N-acetyltransferase [Candidatus Thorarchaeota archaeon]|jgi:predicted acetyltransferase